MKVKVNHYRFFHCAQAGKKKLQFNKLCKEKEFENLWNARNLFLQEIVFVFLKLDRSFVSKNDDFDIAEEFPMGFVTK